jgi:hypothetical protein
MVFKDVEAIMLLNIKKIAAIFFKKAQALNDEGYNRKSY